MSWEETEDAFAERIMREAAAPVETPADDMVEEDHEVMIPAKHLRQLRAKAKRGEELQRKAAALEEELAFRYAGVEPTTAKARYFIKGYRAEGGPLDPDAIRAAARQAGIFSDVDDDRPLTPAEAKQFRHLRRMYEEGLD